MGNKLGYGHAKSAVSEKRKKSFFEEPLGFYEIFFNRINQCYEDMMQFYSKQLKAFFGLRSARKTVRESALLKRSWRACKRSNQNGGCPLKADFRGDVKTRYQKDQAGCCPTIMKMKGRLGRVGRE